MRAHPKHNPEAPIKIDVPVEEEKVEEVKPVVKRPDKTIAECYIKDTDEIMMTYTFDLHGIDFSTYAVNMGKKKGWEVRFK
jgi:hypothetical protein